MMSGYIEGRTARPATTRQYRVLATAQGWCITLDQARTSAFKYRHQAERIAARLQKQADALHSRDRANAE